VTRPRPAPAGGGGRLPWVAAAAVLVGALVLTGRLLGAGDMTRAPATASSGGQAATAAEPLARPAGAVEVEAVFLVPTSAVFRASCQQAADRVGFAVPCPQLLPIPASGAPPSRLCQDGGCQDGLVWLRLEAFLVPPGFTGAPGSLGALAILATPDPDAAAGMRARCRDQRPISTPALGGRRAVLASCPAGFQGWSTDSVLLRWSRRGTSVALALRGRSEANRQLLVSLAGSLRLVTPRS
jgi:hypothetical protein